MSEQVDSFDVIAAVLVVGFARRTLHTLPALMAATEPRTARLRDGCGRLIDQAACQRNPGALLAALDCMADLAEYWQKPFTARRRKDKRRKRVRR
jgi:hypothetical protein